jgi:hypothetical protein
VVGNRLLKIVVVVEFVDHNMLSPSNGTVEFFIPAAPPNLPSIPNDNGKNTVRKNEKKDKKKGKVKLTKDDIGTPTDFRFVIFTC